MNVVKLISEASECNINQFMRCAFDNDLSVLIVSGKPSPKQMEDAFQNILEQFNDLSGQSANTEELVLMRQILILESRNTVFTALVDTYRKAILHADLPFIPDYGFHLFRKYGYEPPAGDGKKPFLEFLDMVEQSEFSYKAEHNELLEELQKIQSESKDAKPTDSRRSFLKQINNIENFYKRQIDFEKYSVERLAILISDFREMIEKQNQQNN